MGKDWDAVATAIQGRLADLDMTQADLAARADVALMTVRELQHNLQTRRRSARTLAAVSEALGWPGDHLARIADGRAAVRDVDAGDPILAELDALKEDLRSVAERLDAIERRLDAEPDPS